MLKQVMLLQFMQPVCPSLQSYVLLEIILCNCFFYICHPFASWVILKLLKQLQLLRIPEAALLVLIVRLGPIFVLISGVALDEQLHLT